MRSKLLIDGYRPIPKEGSAERGYQASSGSSKPSDKPPTPPTPPKAVSAIHRPKE